MRKLALILLSFLFVMTSGCASPPLTPLSTPTSLDTATPAPGSEGENAFTEQREQMVENTIVIRGVSDPEVLEAMRSVPRHRFVPERYEDAAYDDHPLPIGYGQTISQPFIVAWMTELLELQPGEKVLEIGTGSGYQAAVLAEIEGVEVYTIEIIPELAQQAAERLEALGYTQVHVKQGDGYYGWEKHAPYDAIIVTAAPDHLPQPLVEQLKPEGQLVIPIGPPGGYQTLWRFTKDKDGELTAENLGGVAFVPFTGEGQSPPPGPNPPP